MACGAEGDRKRAERRDRESKTSQKAAFQAGAAADRRGNAGTRRIGGGDCASARGQREPGISLVLAVTILLLTNVKIRKSGGKRRKEEEVSKQSEEHLVPSKERFGFYQI
jgi:hypothetical protein